MLDSAAVESAVDGFVRVMVVVQANFAVTITVGLCIYYYVNRLHRFVRLSSYAPVMVAVSYLGIVGLRLWHIWQGEEPFHIYLSLSFFGFGDLTLLVLWRDLVRAKHEMGVER